MDHLGPPAVIKNGGADNDDDCFLLKRSLQVQSNMNQSMY